MPTKTKVALAAAAALFCLSTTAAAQTTPAPSAPSAASTAGAGYRENKDASGSSVIFDDDLNTASGLAPAGETLKVRGGAARFLLIKPRVSFVQELRKSVENL